MVVAYRMGGLSYLVGRLLVRLPHIALPNLVAGRRVVPELIQRDCNPERIAAELLRYLEDPDHTERVRADLAGIRARLGGPGVFERAADAILAELDARHGSAGEARFS
jgi:lipid-A-disaccharide synthase